MTAKSENGGILVFCAKPVGLLALETLIDAGAPIAGLVSVTGKSDSLIEDVARRIDAPYFADIHLQDCSTQETIIALGASMAMSFSFPNLIPVDLLGAFPGGAFNFHPARLPEYRGCFPTLWPILNGDHEADYTMHIMEEEFDAGPVVDRETIPVGDLETGWSLYQRLVGSLPGLIRRNLDAVLSSSFDARPQDGDRAGYYPDRLPCDGLLDWNWPGEKIDRFIRALYHPEFPGAIARIGTIEAEVLAARFIVDDDAGSPPGTIATQSGDVVVSCADGLVALKTIRVDGRTIDFNRTDEIPSIFQ